MAFLVSIFKPLVYISLPVILLQSIAATSKTGKYYARQTLYVGTMVTVAACSIVFAAGLTIVGRKFDVNYVVAKTFYLLARNVLDLRVEVEGQEHLDNARPGVLMANHQSMLDILVVGRLMPKQTSIMSKKSLQYTPLGPFMTMSGAIFIDRGNNVRAIESLNAAGDLMRTRRVSLWMFPEGTRTSSEVPSMRPLKKGGFHLAIQSQLPIIPIVTENYWRLYHRGVFDSGVIKVRILPPVPTAGLTTADIPDLITRVRDQMLDTLREISVVPSSQSSRALQPEHKEKEEEGDEKGYGKSSEAGITAKSELTFVDAGESSVSLVSSASVLTRSSGENGGETEEDEGMILVGRPT
ncbi:putative 1-acyl-sn-glycerol-3-phosphate acyltransferase [Termitomyces sp. T112]|nr:putative 1-acyl-sn-glycerol-3-phosphate acyltransferase [Termitomyces sp. T112]